ncbi:MAG: hypothetical protein KGD60_10930 [Candidatus Thorarchaeota archaeon]|nr:hypothetical protein [Candidatus Thorarchaeota archaeon]
MNARIVETPHGERIVLSTVPPLIEDTILLSFGHSIIDFEATLYEKFLHITKGLVITCEEFKDHLKNMEERGLVMLVDFLGKRGWSRNPEMVEGFEQ